MAGPGPDPQTLEVRSEREIVLVRQAVRSRVVGLGFGLVKQTKVVTAASELARNMLVHGGGGTVRLETLTDEGRRGVQVCFEDQGPGIPDVEQALSDGFSTCRGLGLGLGGARRLVGRFTIDSRVGQGTRVTIAEWE